MIGGYDGRETHDNRYIIHLRDTEPYILIYKTGLKIATYQRSYSMSGHFNHVGIIVDDLGESEQRVRPNLFEPQSIEIMNPGADFISMMTRG